ncbi:hypothetical protein [Streptacidiphilus sp. EB103A]|uniref:hypothetical protein n=1 Tax=Streptacidiphilus sp. EB103A TaxID=3156275 RepID=UPI003513691B
MSTVWQMVTARLGRRRRRWARVERWLPVPVLGALGAGAGVVSVHTGFSFDAALPVWVLAASWPVWRAPEEEVPDALRFRLQVRRAGWRVSVALVLAFSVAQALGTPVDWVLALAPVPVVLEPLLWPLWPRGLRRAVRSAQVYEELVAANRGQARDLVRNKRVVRRRRVLRHQPLARVRAEGTRRNRRRALLREVRRTPGALAMGFDPDRGACGRPLPVRSSEPGARSGPPLRATPVRELLYQWRAQDEGERLERWLRYAVVSWSGQDLLLTDGRQRLVRAGLGWKPEPLPPRQRVLPHRPVELIWLTEKRVDSFRAHVESQILLLDARGRRLLTFPAMGMSQREVGAVAQAAGLRFAAYELAQSGWEWPRPLSSRLFPKRRGHIRLRLS